MCRLQFVLSQHLFYFIARETRPLTINFSCLFAVIMIIIIIIIKEIYRAQDCPKATSAVLSGAHS